MYLVNIDFQLQCLDIKKFVCKKKNERKYFIKE